MSGDMSLDPVTWTLNCDNCFVNNCYKRLMFQVKSNCPKMVSIATGLRFFVVVSTAILQLVHCNPVDDSLIDSRIVGGRIINISQAPYQVSIRDSAGYTFCGGSIISTRHILTAAHCFK